jgi:hypothetical protein
MRRSAFGCIPFCLAFAQAAVAGGPLPREGTAVYVTYYVGRPLASVDMAEAGSQGVSELVGVARNTSGQAIFDNLSVRCLIYRDSTSGRPRYNGSCTETDVDGDRIFTTFDSTVHTLVGGTGKYKGITGSAPYTVNVLKPPGDGMTASVVEHKVTWQFK